MSKKLEGKVAVITSGNSGIGLATAQRFTDEGAHVFITGRRQEEFNRAVTQIGHGAVGVQGDVAKMPDLPSPARRASRRSANSRSARHSRG